MIEILPGIDKSVKKPVYVQLYNYIKKEIENGTIAPKEKLPSIRTLSKKLGISITTVRMAYDQLAMEGYIVNREKSGYFVNSLDFIGEVIHIEHFARENLANSKDFLEIYDEECFDFLKWKKCLSHTLLYDTKMLLSDADLQGEIELREQIAKYVFQSRGVHCTGEDIVVGTGTQELMSILTTILAKSKKKAIGFENPGYVLSQNIFSDKHFETHNFDIDLEGIKIEQIFDKKIDLLYVSPSHQFPTGTVMSASRRSKLLSWANEFSGYIIEDDYDSELRYFGKPIPALKAMDKNNRVIYIGSFSSTLLPSIRISYLVLPKELLAVYRRVKKLYSQGVSKLDQLTLQKFMHEGYYQRHIKRIRRLYSEKSRALSENIQSKFSDRIKIISNTSGLFMILEFNTDKSETEIAGEFVRRGAKATPLSLYVKKKYNKKKPNLLIYFYNIKLFYMQRIMEEVYKILQ